MNLLFIWTCFIILMSFSEELELLHYILFSGSMFYFTYLYNQVEPIKVSLQVIIMLITIPSSISWYIVFVYNDFLCLTPLNHDYFVGLFLFYMCMGAYILFEHSNQNK